MFAELKRAGFVRENKVLCTLADWLENIEE